MLSFNMLINRDESIDLDKNVQNDAIAAPVASSLDCRFEDKIYKDGNQWKSLNNSCQLCYCEKGASRCDLQQCPVLRCKQQMSLNDECCPICKGIFCSLKTFYFIFTYSLFISLDNSINKLKVNEKVGCNLNSDTFYRAGSIWHPYIAPFGFDKCTVCSCLVSLIIVSYITN